MKKTFSILSSSETETKNWAARLATMLRPGDVLALSGDLGAGKTAFVSGLAEKLFIKGQIASPTFTLLRDHEAKEGGIPLFHFDAYRLLDANEWYELGFDEYLQEEGIVAVEWADRVKEALPKSSIWISLERKGDNLRQISISWQDERDLEKAFTFED